MNGFVAFTVLIALVALERVAELVVSKRNLRWSREHGGLEYGHTHYPFMVALHVFLLVGSLVEVWVWQKPLVPALSWTMLALVFVSQGLRWWCIATLGRRWNTLVVVVPGMPRVTGGPYRWLAHPNYVAVVIEGFALPLVGFAWVTALVFTVLNIPLLAVRLRVENAALATLPPGDRSPGPNVIDLLVAGAGPVGLVTAIHGALNGLDVTVVEPRAAPIDKACGEGLMPDAVAHLSRIGVDPDGPPFHGIRYLAGRHVAQARFSAGPGRGVRRTVLHGHLVERARAAGVTFAKGRVSSFDVGAGHVEACGVRARYLVGADGLHSDVRRLAGLARPARGVPRFGLRQHFTVEPWTDLVEVHWLPDVEVYVTPVGERLVGVAVLGSAPLDLPGTLERLPVLRARLAGAEPATRLRGAGPLRQQAAGRCAGRVLLVGDAAGYVDALTGEGLRVGFVEAEAVVRAVLRDDPDAYAEQWPQITRSYRWLTNGLLWTASRPRLRTMIVPTARAMPFAFRRIVDSLAA